MNSQKKLLLLGGTGAMYDVVKRAKAMGIYTIVVDYYPNSPAKRIADKSYLASTNDIEAVLKIARENEIDGVFTGFSDANLMPARLVADELGLPFYASKEQIDVTTNKLLFKETCRHYGIPVVPEFHLDRELKREDLDRIVYPVIVKPSDAWASKGVTICENEEELCEAVLYALQFSKNQRVIVEQYMAAYPDVCMYFNLQDGVVSLSSMCERDMNQVQKGKAMQPNALFYPCRFIPLYYEQLEEKIQNMTTGLGMKDGTMFMQCFVVDGVLMPFEMGYRQCGAQDYILCAAENEIDSCQMMLNYALTGKCQGWNAAEQNKPIFQHHDAILLTLMKPGKITKITGLDELRAMPEILNVVQFYYEGDEIGSGSMGTLNQTFARIFIQGNDADHLLSLIDHVQKTLKVFDENGEQMLLPGYNCTKAHVAKAVFSASNEMYQER